MVVMQGYFFLTEMDGCTQGVLNVFANVDLRNRICDYNMWGFAKYIYKRKYINIDKYQSLTAGPG